MAKIPKPDPQVALKYFQQKLDCTTGPIELSHWLAEGAPVNVVDVRAAEDYEKAHIPGAVNLPKDRWGSAKGLARDKTHVIYCYSQTCHLAAAAAVEFAQLGFSVVELEGGFNTWQKAQLEVVAGN
jgi:rhodanese-related sulfurtransferase